MHRGRHHWWLAAAALVALAVPAANAQSQACNKRLIYNYYWSSSLGLQDYGISHGMSFNTYMDGGQGTTWPYFTAPGDMPKDFFYKDFCGNPPLKGFFVGLIGNGEGDLYDSESPGGTHVVMFARKGMDWRRPFEDIFGVAEATFTDWLISATRWCADEERDADGWCPGAEQGFTNVENVIWNTMGVSGFFDIANNNINAGEFDLWMFSDGDVIGDGFVSLEEEPMAVVPEPESWALMTAGLLMMGAVVSRRRRRMS